MLNAVFSKNFRRIRFIDLQEAQNTKVKSRLLKLRKVKLRLLSYFFIINIVIQK